MGLGASQLDQQKNIDLLLKLGILMYWNELYLWYKHAHTVDPRHTLEHNYISAKQAILENSTGHLIRINFNADSNYLIIISNYSLIELDFHNFLLLS